MVRFQADTVAAPMHMTSEIYITSHFVALGSVLSLPTFFSNPEPQKTQSPVNKQV